MATARLTNSGKRAEVSPYATLRTLPAVVLTPELELSRAEENLAVLHDYAARGYALVPVRRLPYMRTAPPANGGREFPRRVLMEMTSKCNLLCRMCPQQNLTRPLVHMDKDLYMRSIDELDAHGVEGVWLYHFGESLLHPDFEEIVRHVSTKRNLGKVWLSTNGLLLNERYSRAILDSGIDYLNFSLQATSAEVYETVTTKGTYEIARRNLDRFLQMKKELGKSKPFLRLQIIDQEPCREEIDEFLETFYERAEIVSVNQLEHTNIANNAYGKTARDRPTLKKCGRIDRGDCFVNSSGSVTLCDEAYNDQILLGWIQEQSIEEIWNGDARRHYLELNRAERLSEVPICSACTDYDL